MRARLVSSLLLMFALAFPALAQDRRGGASLDRVLPHIRQTVPGTFYDAEGPFFGPNGHPTYRLKWMTPDGRIIWFNVDAETGRVVGGMPGGPPFDVRPNNNAPGPWGGPRNNRGQSNDGGPGNWDNGGDNRGSSWHDNGNDRGQGGGEPDGNNRGRGGRGNDGNDRGRGGWGDGGGQGGDRGGDRGGEQGRKRR